MDIGLGFYSFHGTKEKICFAVSKECIALGDNQGSIWIIRISDRSVVLQLQVQTETSVPGVLSITISPDSNFFTCVNNDGDVIVMQNPNGNVLYKSRDHRAHCVTSFAWRVCRDESPSAIYVADDSGLVTLINIPIAKLSSATSLKLLQLNCGVVQLDYYEDHLLVNTRKNTFICDTALEIFTKAIETEHHGKFGGCLLSVGENRDSHVLLASEKQSLDIFNEKIHTNENMSFFVGDVFHSTEKYRTNGRPFCTEANVSDLIGERNTSATSRHISNAHSEKTMVRIFTARCESQLLEVNLLGTEMKLHCISKIKKIPLIDVYDIADKNSLSSEFDKMSSNLKKKRDLSYNLFVEGSSSAEFYQVQRFKDSYLILINLSGVYCYNPVLQTVIFYLPVSVLGAVSVCGDNLVCKTVNGSILHYTFIAPDEGYLYIRSMDFSRESTNLNSPMSRSLRHSVNKTLADKIISTRYERRRILQTKANGNVSLNSKEDVIKIDPGGFMSSFNKVVMFDVSLSCPEFSNIFSKRNIEISPLSNSGLYRSLNSISRNYLNPCVHNSKFVSPLVNKERNSRDFLYDFGISTSILTNQLLTTVNRKLASVYKIKPYQVSNTCNINVTSDSRRVSYDYPMLCLCENVDDSLNGNAVRNHFNESNNQCVNFVNDNSSHYSSFLRNNGNISGPLRFPTDFHVQRTKYKKAIKSKSKRRFTDEIDPLKKKLLLANNYLSTTDSGFSAFELIVGVCIKRIANINSRIESLLSISNPSFDPVNSWLADYIDILKWFCKECSRLKSVSQSLPSISLVHDKSLRCDVANIILYCIKNVKFLKIPDVTGLDCLPGDTPGRHILTTQFDETADRFFATVLHNCSCFVACDVLLNRLDCYYPKTWKILVRFITSKQSYDVTNVIQLEILKSMHLVRAQSVSLLKLVFENYSLEFFIDVAVMLNSSSLIYDVVFITQYLRRTNGNELICKSEIQLDRNTKHNCLLPRNERSTNVLYLYLTALAKHCDIAKQFLFYWIQSRELCYDLLKSIVKGLTGADTLLCNYKCAFLVNNINFEKIFRPISADVSLPSLHDQITSLLWLMLQGVDKETAVVLSELCRNPLFSQAFFILSIKYKLAPAKELLKSGVLQTGCYYMTNLFFESLDKEDVDDLFATLSAMSEDVIDENDVRCCGCRALVHSGSLTENNNDSVLSSLWRAAVEWSLSQFGAVATVSLLKSHSQSLKTNMLPIDLYRNILLYNCIDRCATADTWRPTWIPFKEEQRLMQLSLNSDHCTGEQPVASRYCSTFCSKTSHFSNIPPENFMLRPRYGRQFDITAECGICTLSLGSAVDDCSKMLQETTPNNECHSSNCKHLSADGITVLECGHVHHSSCLTHTCFKCPKCFV